MADLHLNPPGALGLFPLNQLSITWIQSVWIQIPIYMLLAIGLWVTHFTSPNAGFLTGQMELVIVPTSQGYCED